MCKIKVFMILVFSAKWTRSICSSKIYIGIFKNQFMKHLNMISKILRNHIGLVNLISLVLGFDFLNHYFNISDQRSWANHIGLVNFYIPCFGLRLFEPLVNISKFQKKWQKQSIPKLGCSYNIAICKYCQAFVKKKKKKILRFE